MPGHDAYKEAKEAFVSQLQGGSIRQINTVSLTALTTYTLWAVLRNRQITYAYDDGRATRRRRRQGSQEELATIRKIALRAWALDFAVLVLPVLAACTILSEHLLLLNAILILISSFFLLAYPKPQTLSQDGSGGAEVGARRKAKEAHWSKLSDDEEEEDEEREREATKNERERHDATASATVELSPFPSIATDQTAFRVSVDSSADAAHASAAPPTHFVPPGRTSDDSQQDVKGKAKSAALNDSRGNIYPNGQRAAASPGSPIAVHPHKIVHRSSPSLARSAAPLVGTQGGGASTPYDAAINVYVPRNQPFLTVYRSHMMLMTIICILAVDFNVFPREFAKCETWGTSLMDLGVGSFVFSLGIVSALPMLRASPRERFKPLRLQLLRDLRRSMPLFVLGLIRVLMVKGVDYPEHVSEYGVHWNFFITLALLPFFGTLSRPLARSARFSTIGLLLSALHQFFLTFTDLGGWAASNLVARNTLLSQNKEGLTSLPGYLAIFFLGLDAGHYLLPRDPYLAYRRPAASRKREKTDKLAMLLSSYAILWWSALYVQKFATGAQISRRLANLPYVLWITAYNTLFLLAYVFIYMVWLQPLDERTLYVKIDRDGKAIVPQRQSQSQQPSLRPGTADEDDEKEALALTQGNAKTPALLLALNTHAFAVFLVANLLTGLVNISMQTLYASNFVAMAVLVTYLAACLAFASFARAKGWRIKI